MAKELPIHPRYQRQELFEGVGRDGQHRLSEACVLVVGLGGLGSWGAEILTRAGVGRLRLVDDDHVDYTNIARQAMYTELDAGEDRPKVEAASERLATINPLVDVEIRKDRLSAANVSELAEGTDLVFDGTDNWASRFLINDYCVREGVPWVCGGVVAAEGQVLSVQPGLTACLRCVYDGPPDAEIETANRAAARGVLGSAVATVASLQACRAIRLLVDPPQESQSRLLTLDLWHARLRSVTISGSRKGCPCCEKREFAWLGE
jgi:adenylyltransferase/sulfurtransferase